MTIKSGLKMHWVTLTTVTSLVSLNVKFVHRFNLRNRAPMALFSMVDTGVLVNR
jgi:ATP-binding cassette subfamily C (CFTR/MRP) protein 1